MSCPVNLLITVQQRASSTLVEPGKLFSKYFADPSVMAARLTCFRVITSKTRLGKGSALEVHGTAASTVTVCVHEYFALYAYCKYE